MNNIVEIKTLPAWMEILIDGIQVFNGNPVTLTAFDIQDIIAQVNPKAKVFINQNPDDAWVH